ncbi:MAG: hypothetical protein JST96_15925, partial [Bacteroidetes bacterium]|nr:hypothetical protein [Bacteroidota bacterium]
MRKFCLSLFIILVGVMQACKHKPTPLSTDEVINVINKFDEGWRNKNLELVDSVLSPDYIYFTQSG